LLEVGYFICSNGLFLRNMILFDVIDNNYHET